MGSEAVVGGGMFSAMSGAVEKISEQRFNRRDDGTIGSL